MAVRFCDASANPRSHLLRDCLCESPLRTFFRTTLECPGWAHLCHGPHGQLFVRERNSTPNLGDHEPSPGIQLETYSRYCLFNPVRTTWPAWSRPQSGQQAWKTALRRASDSPQPCRSRSSQPEIRNSGRESRAVILGLDGENLGPENKLESGAHSLRDNR